MDLSNLRPAYGSKQSDNFRRGRGHGSGNGKTAGKGHDVTSLSFYASSSTLTKCLTCCTIPLVAALSGSTTVLPVFLRPRASTVLLCFGMAPIVDFTNVTFKFAISILPPYAIG